MIHGTIPNLRPVCRKLPSIYRSSSPEDAADTLQNDNGTELSEALSSAETVLFNEVTLWIDIRFPTEVNEEKITRITQNAPGGSFEKLTLEDPRRLQSAVGADLRKQRIYLHVSDQTFSINAFICYASKKWTSAEAMVGARTIDEQREIVMKAIAQRGLAGLFECILERHEYVLRILQAITLHMEQRKKDGLPAKILFHCTLGKDRTGIIAMLCQSLVGDSDEEIIEEFVKSKSIKDIASVKLREHFGKLLDSSNMDGADADVMIETLDYLRTQDKYGSVTGYLDFIGFDESWRRRFADVASM
jgi:Tyrosine phosphatase family